MHTVPEHRALRLDLVITPFSWLSPYPLLVFSQHLFAMSSSDPDVWLRELARSGLSVSAQHDLLTSLAQAVADREKFFPSESSPYLCRVRQLLSAAFLPQSGPLIVSVNSDAVPETLSRSQCWQLLHLEFSLLDSKRRPVSRVHDIVTDVIGLLTSSEFPLHIPPRWLVELFSDLARLTSLRMESNGWSLSPPRTLDQASQAYLDAVLVNIENDRRRSQRQLLSFTSGDSEELADSSKQSLLPPLADAIVPPIPPSFPLDFRPRFWLAPQRVDTPKRVRTEADSWSESDDARRDTKRRVSENGGTIPEEPAPGETATRLRWSPTTPPLEVELENKGNRVSLAIVPSVVPPIAASLGTSHPISRVHYSLSSIMQNPLRHYPSAESLYSNVLPDDTLLDLPVFSAAFPPEALSKSFTRGENDPAVSVLNAVGAQRVCADTLEFVTWNEEAQRPQFFFPFSEASDLFHVYALPPRRVAPGENLHEWSFGLRLGLKASGAWSNQIIDKQQPKPPPVLRKIDWRELVQILKAPHQLGLPASSNTDSKLGWAVYTYMAPEVLLNICEGRQHLLLRIEGYCTKGHEASNKEIAQRAKVGLCPCCARATHVLVPPAYPVGRPDRKKRNQISLWQRFGPFGTRNYAAALYINANGTLPDSWDWVASKHVLTIPSALNLEDRAASPERDASVRRDLPHDPPTSPTTRGSLSGGKKVAKPPPPVHKGGATVSPSPAKSHGSLKGSSQHGSSSWQGDWSASGSHFRDWQQHRWYS